MTIQISELHTYPVKSLAGNQHNALDFDRFGPIGDRRFMLITPGGHFVTQREIAALALVQVELDNTTLQLSAKQRKFSLPLEELGNTTQSATVWKDTVSCLDAGDDAAMWLETVTGKKLRLVCMLKDHERLVDPAFSTKPAQTSFTDGFPVLLISQASLDELNCRLAVPVPMKQFRPNLVVAGCEAFAEDTWKRIRIGSVVFDVVKPCSRCGVTTIDTVTAKKNKEPLKTLASFRKGSDGQVYFGQNLIHRSTTGTIRVGDTLEILE